VTAVALDCVNTSAQILSVAAGASENVFAPACESGYTETATLCQSSSWSMPFVYMSDGVCSAQNNGASSAQLKALRRCCRVPAAP
jgi:hypothetical protein